MALSAVTLPGIKKHHPYHPLCNTAMVKVHLQETMAKAQLRHRVHEAVAMAKVQLRTQYKRQVAKAKVQVRNTVQLGRWAGSH